MKISEHLKILVISITCGSGLAYADNFNISKSAVNFVQLNLDATATPDNLKYFHCTVSATPGKPHLTAQSTLPLQAGVTLPKEPVSFVNYAVMISGFMKDGNEKDGTLTLYTKDVNKYAFAYYYDPRLPKETPTAQVFVNRLYYTIDCQPGTDNRPVYKAGHYG